MLLQEISHAFSAIMLLGALVFPEMTFGMMGIQTTPGRLMLSTPRMEFLKPSGPAPNSHVSVDCIISLAGAHNKAIKVSWPAESLRGSSFAVTSFHTSRVTVM